MTAPNPLFNDRLILKWLYENLNSSFALAIAGYSMIINLVLLPLKVRISTNNQTTSEKVIKNQYNYLFYQSLKAMFFVRSFHTLRSLIADTGFRFWPFLYMPYLAWPAPQAKGFLLLPVLLAVRFWDENWLSKFSQVPRKDLKRKFWPREMLVRLVIMM